MNFFYEEYPNSIVVGGREIAVVTDFREYIKLIDMLNDDELKSWEKVSYLKQYFLEEPEDFEKAMEQLTAFIVMEVETKEEKGNQDNAESDKKEVYSFEYDFPFIFSAFLSEYGIHLKKIPYLHWWEFRNLFKGLSEDTEIKKMIAYRSINPSEIKDENERKRIVKIQRAIALPNSKVTDFDIGNAFGW